MKALILAAGRGERLRPLTDSIPKPLVPVAGKPLIAWHLERLAAAGIDDVVINTSWLAASLHAALGDGQPFGLRIRFSDEGDQALGTGGALAHARALLGEDPFVLVNGDVWTDFDFARLLRPLDALAHLILVPVPAQAAQGDFHLDAHGQVQGEGDPLLTYAGIGLYRMALLDLRDKSDVQTGVVAARTFALGPLLRCAMQRGAVSGERHPGRWYDIGTLDRLQALDRQLAKP